MTVLWLLIRRGPAIEFRDHIHSLIWTPFWDFVFSLPAFCSLYSSALLSIQWPVISRTK